MQHALGSIAQLGSLAALQASSKMSGWQSLQKYAYFVTSQEVCCGVTDASHSGSLTQGIASLAHANLAHGAALAAASQGLSVAQLQQLSQVRCAVDSVSVRYHPPCVFATWKCISDSLCLPWHCRAA